MAGSEGTTAEDWTWCPCIDSTSRPFKWAPSWTSIGISSFSNHVCYILICFGFFITCIMISELWGMADTWNRWWGGFIRNYFNLDNDGLKMDRALLKKASWLGVQHYAFRLLIKIHCWIIKIFWMRSITHPEFQVDTGYNAIRQQDSKISKHELVKRSSCS